MRIKPPSPLCGTIGLVALMVILVGCAFDSGATKSPQPSPANPTAVSVPQTPSGNAPVAPNQSLVTAKILSLTLDVQNTTVTLVEVQLLSSTAVSGKLDLARGLVGKSVVLYAQTSELSGVRAGDTIRASVTFLGDERGGTYRASGVQKIQAYP